MHMDMHMYMSMCMDMFACKYMNLYMLSSPSKCLVPCAIHMDVYMCIDMNMCMDIDKDMDL